MTNSARTQVIHDISPPPEQSTHPLAGAPSGAGAASVWWELVSAGAAATVSAYPAPAGWVLRECIARRPPTIPAVIATRIRRVRVRVRDRSIAFASVISDILTSLFLPAYVGAVVVSATCQ
ncbi:hypothetical protein O1W71_14170 [Microbacterium sp. H37-C3]|nr:hypothetical protein [Microbacterium sp. H37-C3]MCZ4068820.1 hypothetical protein [Microbacterium sp. H37-C3]